MSLSQGEDSGKLGFSNLTLKAANLTTHNQQRAPLYFFFNDTLVSLQRRLSFVASFARHNKLGAAVVPFCRYLRRRSFTIILMPISSPEDVRSGEINMEPLTEVGRAKAKI